MNLFDFIEHFPNEEACRNHFKRERDKIGVSCKKCGHSEHYWIKSRWSYECKKCRSRTSLRSGTIMQSSNLSFLTWYKTIFLLSATKKGFSAKEIQRQLGMKRYEPVWCYSEASMAYGKFQYTAVGFPVDQDKISLP